MTLIVVNKSPESSSINTDGIVVYAEDKVLHPHPIHKSKLISPQTREIKQYITRTGLLFATLSLNAPTFEEYFVGLQDLTNKVDFTKLPHRRSISYEGRFNWKTMFVVPSFFG